MGRGHLSSPVPCQDLVPQPSPNICALKKKQKNVSCSKPQRQFSPPRLTAHNDSRVGHCALEAGGGRFLPGPKSCFPRPHLVPAVLEDEGSSPATPGHTSLPAHSGFSPWPAMLPSSRRLQTPHYGHSLQPPPASVATTLLRLERTKLRRPSLIS